MYENFFLFFCMFGFSSHKLVVKPQKNLKAPSKGSAVENLKSAPFAYTFHSVVVIIKYSKFSITCRHFKWSQQLHQALRCLCRFHCHFLLLFSRLILKPLHLFCFPFFCTSTWKIALDNLVLNLCLIIINSSF